TFVIRQFNNLNQEIPLTTAVAGIKGIDTPNGFVESPLVVNAIDPSRLLLGFNALYRSGLTATGAVDRDNVVEILATGAAVNAAVSIDARVTALAYGGRNADGSAAVGVIYRARGSEVRVSEDNGAHWNPAVQVPGASTVRHFALDPTNWRVAYAVGEDAVY